MGISLDGATAALLVVTVQDIEVRDAAWAAITCADAERQIDLWRHIAGLVDGEPALPVLGLLGIAAWIGGQGALANIVLDQAVKTQGYAAHTLFDSLHTVLNAGVNPCEWGQHARDDRGIGDGDSWPSKVMRHRQA